MGIRVMGGATMTDLISRADAMAEFREYVKRAKENGETPTWNDAVSLIGSLPSAEAPPYCVLGQRPPWSEPKTWHEKNGHTYICGACGFEQAIYGNINEYNCCPRCGVYKEYVDYGGIFPQKRTPYREDSK